MGEANTFERFVNAVYNAIDAPVVWFREKIVEPNRPRTCYYHRKFQRVPTIDECLVGDMVCWFEANEQFERDRKVEEEILAILRHRWEICNYLNNPDHERKCADVLKTYLDNAENYYIKYGDLGYVGTAKDALMKQKHRMIWERRKVALSNGE